MANLSPSTADRRPASHYRRQPGEIRPRRRPHRSPRRLGLVALAVGARFSPNEIAARGGSVDAIGGASRDRHEPAAPGHAEGAAGSRGSGRDGEHGYSAKHKLLSLDRDLTTRPDGARVVYASNNGPALFVRALDTVEQGSASSSAKTRRCPMPRRRASSSCSTSTRCSRTSCQGSERRHSNAGQTRLIGGFR